MWKGLLSNFYSTFIKRTCFRIVIHLVYTPRRCCCRKKANEDESEEVIVVEFQVLFREIRKCFRIVTHVVEYTITDACCRKKPNEDELEKVIVVEFQVLFRNTQVLSNSHPCCHTPLPMLPCRTWPNQDESVEVISVGLQVIFDRVKGPLCILLGPI